MNKIFKKKAFYVLAISFVFMYFFAGLQNDHLNVLTPYLQTTYGWTPSRITLPVTFGGFLAIAMFMITATAFMKVGIRKFTTVIALVIILSICGLACSNGNYTIYFISLMILRGMIGTLQLSGMSLCTNWFDCYRGRAIGVITCGPPLFSATGTAILTMGVERFLGFQGTYLCVGGVLLIFTLLYVFLIRDNPEDVGLFPDGAEGASTDNGGEVLGIRFRELMSYKETYLMTVLLCVANFIAICYMGFYVTYLQCAGVSQPVYLPALTIGALCAFPMAFVVGMVSDKFGPCCAFLVVFALGLIPSLLYLTVDCNSLLVCSAIAFGGGASGGGGAAVLAPLITKYYGRARYNAVNRWLFTYFAVTNALAASFMSFFIGQGRPETAFLILIGILVFAMVCAIVLQIFGKIRYTD